MSKKYSYLKAMQEQLPSGADKNAYVDFHKWTYRRWASEFLRRNTDFQIACLSATNAQSRASVAEKYLLRKFKDCRDDYVAGEKPGIFRIAPIQHWMDVQQTLLPIEVEQDDVLNRFVGHGPLIVPRDDGLIYPTGSAYPIDHWIKQYREGRLTPVSGPT